MVSFTIPAELNNHRQWVCWRLQERKGKATKIPINPHTGNLASVDDPSTWGTFAEALAGMQRFGYRGAGFVFTPSDPYFGTDLDKCIDPHTGLLLPLGADIVKRAIRWLKESVCSRASRETLVS